MPKYFDTHCHVHFDDYDADRADMLAQMQQQGVWAIAVGTDLVTSRQVVQLATEQSHIYACIGVHPNDTDEVFDPSAYTPLLGEQVVAVGECGLDYFRMSADKPHQRRNFEAQIQFAIEHQVPLMLHLRSSEGSTDAHDEAWDIVASYKRAHGDALHPHCHFYTMDTQVARKWLELDATFGIPGVVTYKSAEYLRDAVRMLPLNKMVAETDAPYAAPVPHRGKRNEPNFVIEVTKAIAAVRGEDEEQVREQLVQNTLKTFAIAL